MENIKKDSESCQQYNDVPVIYCKQCLSLAVRAFGESDYCDHCGSTDIAEAHISEWEKMYEEKYGVKYLNKKK
jgi:hypothetical protein